MLEALFVCKVYLCQIHVSRYIKQKILPSACYDDSDSLSSSDKVKILSAFISVLHAPTLEQITLRKDNLQDLTRGVFVKPSRTTSFVALNDYLERNWFTCEERWIFFHRKQLPTQVRCFICHSPTQPNLSWTHPTSQTFRCN